MSILNLIDQASTLRLTIALVHFLWQGTLIAIAAAIASWLLRRSSANTRYAVHVAALAVMSVCVAVTLAWVDVPTPAGVSSGVAHPAAGASDSAVTDSRSDEAVDLELSGDPPGSAAALSPAADERLIATSAAADAEREAGTRPLDAEAATIAPSNSPRESAAGSRLLVRAAPYISLGYLSCVLILLIRLGRGAWDSRRLRRAATEILDRDLTERVREQAERLGMHIVPAVRWCASVTVPAVIGVLRPVVLLPATATTGLSPDQLQAIITHELAHVRRYDLVVNLLQRVIETLLFFHPAVWWISRQVSREREEACDELVLSAG